VKPQLSREGCGGLIRRIPTRLYFVLQAIQDQGSRDSAGKPAATKLRVGLNLDLEFSPIAVIGDRARPISIRMEK
jgi:hypothetical protein